MDLGCFAERYRLGAAGRAPFDPAVMVALLLYAFARGIRSSRGIERACWEDVAFKVITGMRCPDHSTIAEFRRRHEAEIAGLFDEVLGLCREAGLVSVGVITIDGTKIKGPDADASYVANSLARCRLDQTTKGVVGHDAGSARSGRSRNLCTYRYRWRVDVPPASGPGLPRLDGWDGRASSSGLPEASLLAGGCRYDMDALRSFFNTLPVGPMGRSSRNSTHPWVLVCRDARLHEVDDLLLGGGGAGLAAVRTP